ncbi:hypothetical protein KEC55_29095 [Burkholderia cepacia]|uniref:hypothetical protein n=1 Tax=Burkholderia cepacia TaxID=292 RepID=UPI00249F91FB|nr:hypothetical protein [Burkholderia cepacia]WGY72889.1 hypothetical protein KEC55_29095 [Burkholderia cepacia]
MMVGGAEHEIDFVSIRFPIRLKASFDRIHPALRQMASRRSRLDLNKHAEQTDPDALRRLPGPSCYVDFFRERTVRFGAPSNSIFSTIFSDCQYTMHEPCRQCDRLHNTKYETPNPDRLFSLPDNFIRIHFFHDIAAPQIEKSLIDQTNTDPRNAAGP